MLLVTRLRSRGRERATWADWSKPRPK